MRLSGIGDGMMCGRASAMGCLLVLTVASQLLSCCLPVTQAYTDPDQCEYMHDH